jgi:hypothetical protein
MKIEMGKKYKTRDGRNVRIYAVDGFGVYCVHGAYFDTADYGEVGWIDDYMDNLTEKSLKGQKGFDLELVGVKEDWEVAKDILETKENLHIKIRNKIYLAEEVTSHCDDSVQFMHSGTSYVDIVLKNEFKLATKEEVIEYFFGGENEN